GRAGCRGAGGRATAGTPEGGLVGWVHFTRTNLPVPSEPVIVMLSPSILTLTLLLSPPPNNPPLVFLSFRPENSTSSPERRLYVAAAPIFGPLLAMASFICGSLNSAPTFTFPSGVNSKYT